MAEGRTGVWFSDFKGLRLIARGKGPLIRPLGPFSLKGRGDKGYRFRVVKSIVSWRRERRNPFFADQSLGGKGKGAEGLVPTIPVRHPSLRRLAHWAAEHAAGFVGGHGLAE